MTTFNKSLLALAGAAALAFGGAAQATPLIDFANDGSGYFWPGNNSGCNGGCTLGYVFSLTSAVTVDGLGVYDAGSDGLANSHEVGLWTSGGTLLASGAVGGSPSGDASVSGDGMFRWADIGAMTLGAGSYVVAALYEDGDSDHVVFGASGIFSNDAAASYGGSAWINAGVLAMPNSLAGANDRYFGANVRIGESVPEPASLALAGLALAGLAASRRRKV